MKYFDIIADIQSVGKESRNTIDKCKSECIISARLNTDDVVTTDTPPELWPLILEGKSEELGEFEIRIRNVDSGYTGKGPQTMKNILEYAGFKLNHFNQKRITTQKFYGERWIKAEME